MVEAADLHSTRSAPVYKLQCQPVARSVGPQPINTLPNKRPGTVASLTGLKTLHHSPGFQLPVSYPNHVDSMGREQGEPCAARTVNRRRKTRARELLKEANTLCGQ